jgi:hypothetical protein
LYGISQKPNTNYYILIFEWTNRNEKIDDLIRKMQLKIICSDNIALKWISYNQFDKIEKTGGNNLITVYSAVWKDSPLYQNWCTNNYTRNSNKVALKCLHNSKHSIEFVINEV